VRIPGTGHPKRRRHPEVIGSFRYNESMRLHIRHGHLVFLAFLLAFPVFLVAQTAPLREIHAEGLKTLTEAQVAELSGLSVGKEVGRQDLQAASEELVRTGLFAKVTYNFTTKNDAAVLLTFHLEENQRLVVSYDNFPWYADSELSEAIRKDLPFFDGTLPEAGAVVDIAAKSLSNYLASKGASATVEHLVLASPLADASIQQFHAEGLAPRIASVEFSDPEIKQSRAVQQHLSELVGKSYSRLAIDVFLAEQIRPIYFERGYLHAKIGPAEVRLSGNPNQKLPEEIPIFIPCDPGPVYRWKNVTWKGNNGFSTIALTRILGVKPGELANGMAFEAALDRIREEYGHVGYLDAKLEPVSTFDDAAHTVSYAITVNEGTQYRFNGLTITGISITGEKLVREAWTQQPGAVFDKTLFEQLLTKLEHHHEAVFHEVPVHYDTVGHYLQPDPAKKTVDVLLDFK
jgi:outer membrane protein insertion porin family